VISRNRLAVGRFNAASLTSAPSRWFGGIDRFDVIAVLMLLALYLAVAISPIAPKKFGDGDFHTEAKTLALAIQGAAPSTDVSITHAPAPVVYYLIPYLAVPPGSDDNTYWLAAVIWTIGWMVLSLLLIRRTGEMIGGALMGKLAAGFVILAPFGVYYSYGILAEVPAYIGAVLLVYGWASWRTLSHKPSPFRGKSWLVWIGLALFVLSRPDALVLLPLALVAAAILWWTRSPESRRDAKLTTVSIIIAGFLVAMSSVIVTLLPVRAGSRPQTDTLSHVALQGRFQYRTEPWDWREWSRANRQGSADHTQWANKRAEFKRESEETGIPVSKIQWKWILNDIWAHPIITVQMSLIRLLTVNLSFVNSRKSEAFRIGPLSGRFVYVGFHLLVNLLNVIIVAASLWFLFTRPRELAFYWVLWGPWLALLIFRTLTYGEPRHLYAGRPGLVIMAAIVLEPAFVLVKSRIENGIRKFHEFPSIKSRESCGT
jgi:hypothetical protein